MSSTTLVLNIITAAMPTNNRTASVLNNSNHIDMDVGYIIFIAFIPLILLIILRVAGWMCDNCPCNCCCFSNKNTSQNNSEKNIIV